METLKLKAEIREKVGGLSSKQLIYKEGRIPGIIYGGKKLLKNVYRNLE